MNSDLLNADEARKKALSITTEKHNKQLLEIQILIDIAISNGEAQAHLYKAIYAPVKEVLLNKGYTVTGSFDRNEDLTTISW